MEKSSVQREPGEGSGEREERLLLPAGLSDLLGGPGQDPPLSFIFLLCTTESDLICAFNKVICGPGRRAEVMESISERKDGRQIWATAV